MKPFYIVSSLSTDRSFQELACRKKYDTEKEAIEVATNLIKDRRAKGRPDLSFYILKVGTVVAHAAPPIKVTRLK